MGTTSKPAACDFWIPEFEYEHRDDGTILMWRTGELTDYLPTLADYLDKWADETPSQAWIVRRQKGQGWREISYGEAREQVRCLGASLLQLGLGPERPLACFIG